MKKYILGAVLSIGLLVSPAFTQAAGLTITQANSLITVVQSAPSVPASAFVNLITSFSNITVIQATSLITVVQSAPSTAASAFVNLLISFTSDTSIAQPTTPAVTVTPTYTAPVVTPQPATSITQPAPASAIISYVLSPNNPENQKVLLPEQTATIVGTNFPTNYALLVNIGSYSTNGQTNSDGTQVVFAVPSQISAGAYSLYLSTQKGSLTNTISVTVGSLSTPAVDLKANGSNGPVTDVPFGGIINLTWKSENVSSCVASSNNSNQFWSGSKPVSGGESVSMPAVDVATYVITCTGANGTTASGYVQVY